MRAHDPIQTQPVPFTAGATTPSDKLTAIEVHAKLVSVDASDANDRNRLGGINRSLIDKFRTAEIADVASIA